MLHELLLPRDRSGGRQWGRASGEALRHGTALHARQADGDVQGLRPSGGRYAVPQGLVVPPVLEKGRSQGATEILLS